GGIAQVGLDRVDLADLAERLQMSGQFRPADCDADAVVTLGERAHDVPPQKARSPENRDQRVEIRCHAAHFLDSLAESTGGSFSRVLSGFALRRTNCPVL